MRKRKSVPDPLEKKSDVSKHLVVNCTAVLPTEKRQVIMKRGIFFLD